MVVVVVVVGADVEVPDLGAVVVVVEPELLAASTAFTAAARSVSAALMALA